MGKIVWIASYPKSGNTWMRAFLHNMLANTDDPAFLNDLARFAPGESAPSFYQRFNDKPLTEWSIADVAKMRPQVHEYLTTLFPGNVFVKTHSSLKRDHGYPTINLDVTAGAIYVVRNPLDVAVSLAHHMGYSFDEAIRALARTDERTRTMDRFVTELRGSWSHNVATWTVRAHPTLHVVRYEDLLADPGKAFGGVATFLGIPDGQGRIAEAIEKTSFDALRAQEKFYGFAESSAHAEKFFRTGESGQWRNRLSRAQAAAVVAAHRQQMARFGYIPPGF